MHPPATTSSTRNNIVQSGTNGGSTTALTQLSPLPLPDQSVFDLQEHVFSAKRSASKIRPPSPPTKSPPFVRSRIFTTPSYPTPNISSSSTSAAQVDLTPNSQKALLVEKFDDIKVIGKGSFGEVFCAKSKENNRYYAIKKAKRQYRSSKDRYAYTSVSALMCVISERSLAEAFVGCSLPPHPNCVKYYAAWEEQGYLFIQTELCKGSLKDYIESKDVIAEEEIWHFLLDISLVSLTSDVKRNPPKGLKHIHDNNLIHLDIKPGNILFTHQRTLKIGDFGLTTQRKSTLDNEGDCLYVAPELFEGTVTTASDIFSLGATIFEMGTNITMPKNGNLWHLLRQGASFSLVPDAPRRSQDLEHLVKLMMEPVPSKRPTIDQILSHPILKRLYHDRKLEAMDEDVSEGEGLLDTRIIASRSSLQKQRSHQRRESLEAMLGSKLDEDVATETDALAYTAIAPVNLMSVRVYFERSNLVVAF